MGKCDQYINLHKSLHAIPKKLSHCQFGSDALIWETRIMRLIVRSKTEMNVAPDSKSAYPLGKQRNHKSNPRVVPFSFRIRYLHAILSLYVSHNFYIARNTSQHFPWRMYKMQPSRHDARLPWKTKFLTFLPHRTIVMDPNSLQIVWHPRMLRTFMIGKIHIAIGYNHF